jgi:hypothetical protein
MHSPGAAGSPLERRRSAVGGRVSTAREKRGGGEQPAHRQCKIGGPEWSNPAPQTATTTTPRLPFGLAAQKQAVAGCRPCSPCSPCSRWVRSRRRNGNETSGSAQGTSARPWLGRSLQPSISETRPSTQLPCPEPASAEVPTVGTARRARRARRESHHTAIVIAVACHGLPWPALAVCYSRARQSTPPPPPPPPPPSLCVHKTPAQRPAQASHATACSLDHRLPDHPVLTSPASQ